MPERGEQEIEELDSGKGGHELETEHCVCLRLSVDVLLGTVVEKQRGEKTAGGVVREVYSSIMTFLSTHSKIMAKEKYFFCMKTCT